MGQVCVPQNIDGTDNGINDGSNDGSNDGGSDGVNDGGGGDQDTQNNTPQYKTTTLKHDGFDFSSDAIPASWEDSDGETVNWAPYPTVNQLSYTDYVWWRTFSNDDNNNYTKDMGAVSMSSVISVPTTWDGGQDQELSPLQVGHVYVVKCLDGYAKFLVKSIDAVNWTADVEYEYTTGTTFAN